MACMGTRLVVLLLSRHDYALVLTQLLSPFLHTLPRMRIVGPLMTGRDRIMARFLVRPDPTVSGPRTKYFVTGPINGGWMSTSKTPWVRLLLWLKPEQETAISNFLLYWQQVLFESLWRIRWSRQSGISSPNLFITSRPSKVKSRNLRGKALTDDSRSTLSSPWDSLAIAIKYFNRRNSVWQDLFTMGDRK